MRSIKRYGYAIEMGGNLFSVFAENKDMPGKQVQCEKKGKKRDGFSGKILIFK
jgi:hypothetical protein